MKKILSLILFTLSPFVGNSFAQSHLIATLEHEGSLSVFSGPDAFIEAHEAAAHGDVITLSSGMFNAIDITKAITLHGNGCMSDSINNLTYIKGDFACEVPDTIEQHLMIEGIFCNAIQCKKLKEAQFVKCRLYSFIVSSDGSVDNVHFIQCKFSYKLQNVSASGTIYLSNCVTNDVDNFRSAGSPTSAFDFKNCVIKTISSGSDNIYIYRSSLTNCFLYSNVSSTSNNHSTYLNNTNYAHSCVGYHRYKSKKLFQTIDNTTDIEVDSLSHVFKTWLWGAYSDEETFELTDEAKTKYLGNDGTQIGIYGGPTPYDPTPSNPRIAKLYVTPKPNEGKLEIQLEAK